MPFEDGGPPLLADPPTTIWEAAYAPQTGQEGGGGVAGPPAPLGDPEIFPFWAVF